MRTLRSARTYNQNHIPRKYTPGKRRMSIYWTWSYPWESQRDPAAMENRFSTMTEVRTALWPAYETPEWSAAQFLQGIAGTLELFHRSTLSWTLLKTWPSLSISDSLLEDGSEVIRWVGSRVFLMSMIG